MKLKTHYMLSRIASENQSGLSLLQKKAFCIGSLLPDLSPMQFIHRHFYTKSAKYVFKKLRRLYGKNSLASMLAYGKMAHYCSDFCCSVHRDGKIGNPSEHIKYESALEIFAINNKSKIKECIRKGTNGLKLHEIFNTYNSSLKYNYLYDLNMALKACSIICAGAVYNKNVSHKTVPFNTGESNTAEVC